MKSFLVFLLGCFILTSSSAAVQLQVDRDNLSVDEILTVVISSNDHLSINPDLSLLKNDFDVVGTSRSSQFNIINGTTEMQTQWQIALLPKHAGDITIPAMQIGKERTEPHLVHIMPIRQAAPTKDPQNRDMFIEATVIPKEIFLQEQIIYTLKFYFNRTIESPYLMPPDLADAKIAQNGQDAIYTIVKNGKYYRVLERSYIITPKNTGSFQIQPAVLKGYLDDGISSTDIYGFSNRSSRPVKIVGPTIDINVKPKPANFMGQWLPARKLTLNESWEPTPPVFKEGEPITRVIEVNAQGATGDQIPNIVVPDSNGLNIYPQQPKRETETNGNLQVGKMTQKIVFIPTVSGKVVMPAIKVHWWNSVTQKEQIAIIPEKTVIVAPAIVKPTTKPIKTNPAISQSVSTNVATPPTHLKAEKKKDRDYFWPLIALLSIVAWLVTMLMWRRQVKKSKTKDHRNPLSISEIQSRLKEAALTNNARQARFYFLEWAVSKWKDPSLHSLADVVHILEKEQAQSLLSEIMKLEATFYSGSKQEWNGREFWQAFEHFLASTDAKHNQTKVDPLPPLYFTGSST